MEVLKTLVIVVIIFGVGILGEETKRKGKCNSKKGGQRFNNKPNVLRKPYPLARQDEYGLNQAKGTSYQTESETPYETAQETPYSYQSAQETPYSYGFDSNADPEESSSSYYEGAPRFSISADGEVSYGRSLKLENHRNFHDSDDSSHSHNDHMDEDHDHFHKIRTVRGAPSFNHESGPQQLASALSQLQGALQSTDVNNGAQAGDQFLMTASGNDINASNQGNSAVSGSGIISSSGSTTVTTSNSNNSGWKQ